MKTTILCVAIAGMFTAAANAQNENITWQTPTAISGPSDVNTLGTYFASWAPYNQDSFNNGSAGLVVNGTKFLAQTDFQDLNLVNFNSGYTFYNNPGTSDANYNDLLQSAAYNGNGDGSPLSLTWGAMTPGDTYLVQLWANDGRGNGRSETFTGGANTSRKPAIWESSRGGYYRLHVCCRQYRPGDDYDERNRLRQRSLPSIEYHTSSGHQPDSGAFRARPSRRRRGCAVLWLPPHVPRSLKVCRAYHHTNRTATNSARSRPTPV